MLPDANPRTPLRPTLRTVVLRHETPDGGFHFDWMLEPPSPSGQPAKMLITFRLSSRPDLAPGPVAAERLPDHRSDFLEYEGELTRDRGRVFRVARGLVSFPEGADPHDVERLVFRCRFDGTPDEGVWTGTKVPGKTAEWTFSRTTD